MKKALLLSTLIVTFLFIQLSTVYSQTTVKVDTDVKAVPKTTQKRFVKPTMSVASFIGGKTALDTYILKNLVYPDLARAYSIEGRVVARVKLDSAGKVKSVGIIQPLGFGCDEEVKRLLSKADQWIPARQGIYKVPSSLLVNIDFKLQ
jgi:TonB family protein